MEYSEKYIIEKLLLKYESVLNKAYTMSKINRKQSDEKYFEADKILKEINMLKK